FLHSVKMDVANDCFIMDDGKQYCQAGDKKLSFFVNEVEQASSEITSYVLEDNDRFLVIYGNETAEEIQQELLRLKAIPIFRS
ncbi:MAG: protein-disulfide isomerase, partial [Nitrososphaera sp.]